MNFLLSYVPLRLNVFHAEAYAYAEASAYKEGRGGYAEEYFVSLRLIQLTPGPSLEREGCPGGIII